MKMINVIYASGALKKFLDARAQGASKEILTQLSAAALLETEPAHGGAPPHLKLVWPGVRCDRIRGIFAK